MQCPHCDKIFKTPMDNKISSVQSWRYKQVKKWLKRIDTFKNKSNNVHEIHAWNEIRTWVESLMKRRYYNEKTGSIRIRDEYE